MMVLASFFNTDGSRERGIYECSEKFFEDNTKNCNIIVYIPLSVKGKTYKERKENLRNLAIEYNICFNDLYGDEGTLSYGELNTIEDFFYTNGKRYGLLEEFRENAIC